jgi:hypothetical protein
MSIKGPGEKPFIPPITPKEANKPGKAAEEQLTPRPVTPQSTRPAIGRGPEMDSQAIQLATRMAALAVEAKEKELKFEDIIDRVIAETGMTNPQGAMEEANQKRQKEIENEITKIKENKDLMEDAESWQNFAELLTNMNEEQVESFIGLLKSEISSL